MAVETHVGDKVAAVRDERICPQGHLLRSRLGGVASSEDNRARRPDVVDKVEVLRVQGRDVGNSSDATLDDMEVCQVVRLGEPADEV